MNYELWDTETGNLVEDFETEAAALEAARELIALNAPAYPACLALARRREDGQSTWLGAGAELVDLIQGVKSPDYKRRSA